VLSQFEGKFTYGRLSVKNIQIDPRGLDIYRFPVSPNLAATEEAGAKPVALALSGSDEAKEPARSFLKFARKDLTAEQAASPAGVRWLQYEADRLETECNITKHALEAVRGDHDKLSGEFHNQRVQLETLRGAKNASIRNEILANLCLAAGFAGLGAVPGYFSIATAASLAYVGLIISGVLVIGGITCRVWK
jgi:hypothetical protein